MNGESTRLIRAAFAALLLAVSLSAHGAEPRLQSDARGLPTLAPLVNEVTPAVVNISVVSRAAPEDNPLFRDPFFRRFFNLPDKPQRQEQSAGSGVIVDARRGYVITNHHVIRNAEQVLVTLKDRRQFPAKLVGTDPGTDIAVLQIEAEGPVRDPHRRFRHAAGRRLRDRDRQPVRHRPDRHLGHRQRAGQERPLARGLRGFHPDRRLDQPRQLGRRAGQPARRADRHQHRDPRPLRRQRRHRLRGALQHDARGDRTRSCASAKSGAGVSASRWRTSRPALAKKLGVALQEGVVIANVQPGSPAEKAGLRARDVVVALNGRPMRTASEMRARLGLTPVGEEIDLQVHRGGETRNIRATIAPPQDAASAGGQGRAADAGDERGGDREAAARSTSASRAADWWYRPSRNGAAPRRPASARATSSTR